MYSCLQDARYKLENIELKMYRNLNISEVSKLTTEKEKNKEVNTNALRKKKIWLPEAKQSMKK